MSSVDIFGNLVDPEVGYARGRILSCRGDEVRRRVWAFQLMEEWLQRSGYVYDLSNVLTAYRLRDLATYKEGLQILDEIRRLAKRKLGLRLLRLNGQIQIPADEILLLAMSRANIGYTEVVPVEASSALSNLLIMHYGILTTPSLGRPGIEPSIRIDSTSPDLLEVDANLVVDALDDCLDRLAEAIEDVYIIGELILGHLLKDILV